MRDIVARSADVGGFTASFYTFVGKTIYYYFSVYYG
jgi:hypothetical protein